MPRLHRLHSARKQSPRAAAAQATDEREPLLPCSIRYLLPSPQPATPKPPARLDGPAPGYVCARPGWPWALRPSRCRWRRASAAPGSRAWHASRSSCGRTAPAAGPHVALSVARDAFWPGGALPSWLPQTSAPATPDPPSPSALAARLATLSLPSGPSSPSVADPPEFLSSPGPASPETSQLSSSNRSYDADAAAWLDSSTSALASVVLPASQHRSQGQAPGSERWRRTCAPPAPGTRRGRPPWDPSGWISPLHSCPPYPGSAAVNTWRRAAARGPGLARRGGSRGDWWTPTQVNPWFARLDWT
mmetsp:Transcript_42443/g.92173  ORF Transcript_42443/g.92173 Transcript_42443/m.92173 type:complete len:304 (-) Transcript_42443:472-1383(-)